MFIKIIETDSNNKCFNAEVDRFTREFVEVKNEAEFKELIQNRELIGKYNGPGKVFLLSYREKRNQQGNEMVISGRFEFYQIGETGKTIDQVRVR